MEFRNGNETDMDGAEASLFAAEEPQSQIKSGKTKEAGASPAVAMTQKTDAGEADLVAQLGAEALANAVGGAIKAAASTKQDSKGAGKGAAAPVCPNCGGNWVVQRDGKNSCRVCGTRW